MAFLPPVFGHEAGGEIFLARVGESRFGGGGGGVRGWLVGEGGVVEDGVGGDCCGGVVDWVGGEGGGGGRLGELHSGGVGVEGGWLGVE